MSTASPRSSPDPLNRASPHNPLIDRIPPGWGDTIVLLGRILIGGIFVQSGFEFFFERFNALGQVLLDLSHLGYLPSIILNEPNANWRPEYHTLDERRPANSLSGMGSCDLRT